MCPSAQRIFRLVLRGIADCSAGAEVMGDHASLSPLGQKPTVRPFAPDSHVPIVSTAGISKPNHLGGSGMVDINERFDGGLPNFQPPPAVGNRGQAQFASGLSVDELKLWLARQQSLEQQQQQWNAAKVGNGLPPYAPSPNTAFNRPPPIPTAAQRDAALVSQLRQTAAAPNPAVNQALQARISALHQQAQVTGQPARTNTQLQNAVAAWYLLNNGTPPSASTQMNNLYNVPGNNGYGQNTNIAAAAAAAAMLATSQRQNEVNLTQLLQAQQAAQAQDAARNQAVWLANSGANNFGGASRQFLLNAAARGANVRASPAQVALAQNTPQVQPAHALNAAANRQRAMNQAYANLQLPQSPAQAGPAAKRVPDHVQLQMLQAAIRNANANAAPAFAGVQKSQQFPPAAVGNNRTPDLNAALLEQIARLQLAGGQQPDNTFNMYANQQQADASTLLGLKRAATPTSYQQTSMSGQNLFDGHGLQYTEVRPVGFDPSGAAKHGIIGERSKAGRASVDVSSLSRAALHVSNLGRASLDARSLADPMVDTIGLQSPAFPTAQEANVERLSAESSAFGNGFKGPFFNPPRPQELEMFLNCVGKRFAQLNITVEQALTAGLLGGLSTAQVKILRDAHSAELEVLSSEANSVGVPSENGLPTLDEERLVPNESKGQISQEASETQTSTLGTAASVGPEEPASFNAFTYDFFGDSGKDGGLLEELEPDGEQGGLELTNAQDVEDHKMLASEGPTSKYRVSWGSDDGDNELARQDMPSVVSNLPTQLANLNWGTGFS